MEITLCETDVKAIMAILDTTIRNCLYRDEDGDAAALIEIENILKTYGY